jgi:hypothetical protein
VQPPSFDAHQREAAERAQFQRYGNVSTVGSGAGQVQRPGGAAGASRRGLWLGLGGAALVGGLVAAVAVGGGSGGGDDGGGGGGGDGGDGSGEIVAEGGSADGAGSGSAEGAGAGAAEGSGAGSASGGGGGSGGESEIPADEAADLAALEAMLKELSALDPSMVPPAMRKQLEEMKKLAKLSPQERRAKLRSLDIPLDLSGLLEVVTAMDPGAMSRKPAAGSGTQPAEAPDPDAPGAGKPGAGKPGASKPGASKPGVGKPAGAWVTARDLSFAGFDPKRLDVSAFIRWAITEAKKADPDAVLFRIDVSGVGPDGTANLELPTLASGHGSLDLRFFSPARAKRDPNLPLGVPEQNKTCEFRIEAEPDGVAIRPLTGFDCKGNDPVPPPRCSAAALWKRALAAKAPRNAVASLGYRAWSGAARWYFDIGFAGDKSFSRTFGDDC